MKSYQKYLLIFAVISAIILSFFAGSYVKEQEHNANRMQRCATLITFAMDKLESGDLSDPGTMKALISNVYAAYHFYDDSILAQQLHDLWNYLIFESSSPEDTQAVASHELQDILRAMKAES